MNMNVKLNGKHIAALLGNLNDPDAPTTAVALCADGTVAVLEDVDDVDRQDELDVVRILRHPGQEWAQELVDAALDQALEEGTPTRQATILAAAGREATCELRAEAAVLAAAALLPQIPARQPKHRADPAALAA